MERWLTDTQEVKKKYPPPIISLAIIKSSLGETAEACAILNELQKSAGAWRPKIVEVANQIGCGWAGGQSQISS